MGLGLIKNVVAILKGQKSPGATAAGFAVGAMLGLIPKGNLLGIFFFLLFFLTTVDKGAALIAAALWTPIGLILDPIAHRIGYALLSVSSLKGLWSALYNMPVVPWTGFNNTVVLGQAVLGLILFPVNFFLAKSLVSYYQKALKAKVDQLKVIQALKAMRWYQWYDSIGS